MLGARDIVVRYPDGTRALNGVSLDAPAGTVHGLLGPNGAGKSTLLRVLATVQRPDSGTVTIRDIDALADPNAARAQLGFLPQEFGFPAALTPAELLDHVARLKGFDIAAVRRDEVAAMLERVNLAAHRGRRLKTLSRGMTQRLGIALALIGAPSVLIVDEPTTALDPAERHRIHDLLAEVAEERAVVLSTHLVADVEALCQSVTILDHGRVVISGRPAALIDALNGRVFRARVARTEADALRASVRVVREFLVSGQVQITVIADAPPSRHFAAAAPTLDDVFADATAEQ